MSRLLMDEIEATFRHLVAEGVIIHGPHTVVHHDENGFPLEFRICPSFLRKPQTVGAELDISSLGGHGSSGGGSGGAKAKAKGRKWGPGSDMYLSDPRLIVAPLNGGTHDLALNLFAVDDAQLMMLTADTYRRQSEPLDMDDVGAALAVLRDLGTEVYVIYNGGREAGCSRMHKHMQGLRGPPHAFHVMVAEEEEDDEAGAGKAGKVPFVFFKHWFAEGFGATSAEEVFRVYERLLARSRDALGLDEPGGADGERREGQEEDEEKGEGRGCPHNVVMWRDWLLVIPRRRAELGGASANAVGMCGSPWVPERDQVDEWLRLGPREVLAALGVPRT
ncbi:hypothetical protein N3K66_004296 [Trichothecium roseum]|uniref:Uncharacterized protein n=1 Tax=Trichothecium roseum TaxID=47278 RepID=A0ACC0V2B8_9HYPO|nr:hypothetical protein N3K66_004296 [Trichothecium roseum]